ncbi:MAG: hypothetical protein R2684_10440 [Pyrinomonadaceae bacterium]
MSNANTGNISGNEVVKPKEVPAPPGANSNTNLVPAKGVDGNSNPTLQPPKNLQVIDTNKAATMPAKKLADNSEVTVSQTKEGYFIESRRFLNNPQLEKVEKILKSPKDITYRVHLRTGKVIEVSGDTIKGFRTDTASMILRAVGIEPEQRKDPRGEKPGGNPMPKVPAAN